jgi:hypothetical protein
VKDDLTLKSPGMYNILCRCEMVYTAQTSHYTEAGSNSSISTSAFSIHISQMKQSGIHLGHHTLIQDISILAKKNQHMDQIIREVTELNYISTI